MEVLMRRQNRRERGEGNFGCLVGVIFIVLALFVAYKMIPIKVKNAEIRQVVTDEAKSAGTHQDGRIKETILAKAREDNLPITEDDIDIKRNNNEITIDVNYTVPVVFPGYTYQWKINHHVNNPIF
jgi:predicted membrane protein